MLKMRLCNLCTLTQQHVLMCALSLSQNNISGTSALCQIGSQVVCVWHACMVSQQQYLDIGMRATFARQAVFRQSTAPYATSHRYLWGLIR